MGYDLTGCKAKNESGEYFRNNVWWWRNLWNFVCRECGDFMKDKDIEAGGSNSGMKIVAPIANKIAKQLTKSVESGIALAYEKEIKAIMKKAKAHNKRVNAKFKEPKNETQKERSVRFSLKFKEEDWREHYPFSVENVKDFIVFVENSGGFRIC